MDVFATDCEGGADCTRSPTGEQPKRKPAKRKAASSAAAPSTPRDEEDGLANRRCTQCRQLKPPSMFSQSKGKCSPCDNKFRNVRAFAQRSGLAQWFDSLPPEKQNHVVKAYSKEVDVAKKEGRRTKFSLKTYKEEFSAATGYRYEGRRRFMWYGAYVEYAKSASGGFLTEDEIKANWSRWEADPTTPRNQHGPRGSCQLAVPIENDIVDYNDVSRKRTLGQEQKLSKDTSDENMAKRFKLQVVGGHASDDAIVDMGQLRKQTDSAYAFNATSAASASSWQGGLPSTTCTCLTSRVSRRTRRRRKQSFRTTRTVPSRRTTMKWRHLRTASRSSQSAPTTHWELFAHMLVPHHVFTKQTIRGLQAQAQLRFH